MKNSHLLSEKIFPLILMNISLVIALFFTYSTYQEALNELLKYGKGDNIIWLIIIVGWVLFIQPLILLVASWILSIVITVLSYKWTVNDLGYVPFILSVVGNILFCFVTFFSLTEPKLLFVTIGSYLLNTFALFFMMKRQEVSN